MGKIRVCFIAASALLALVADSGMCAASHYVFFGRNRDQITTPAFLETSAIKGAQLIYTWRELEPGPGTYDFASIRQDFEFLRNKGKKLFVQLQDSSFDERIINVPRYLLEDKRFNGGADKEYDSQGKIYGWVARRWDNAVRERFHALLAALGKEFDGKVEGINLPETAVEIEEGTPTTPKGFTYQEYRRGVIKNMDALKNAFPKSVAMHYANFMPGEWLPEDDKSFLRSVYSHALQKKIGIGGPDLLPNKPGQMRHAYRFIPDLAGQVPIGIAVQEGNYEHINPRTQKRTTVAELLDFAENHLKVDYVFWGTQEPYYSKELIPFLNGLPLKPQQRAEGRLRPGR